jgi:hypothetical protein
MSASITVVPGDTDGEREDGEDAESGIPDTHPKAMSHVTRRRVRARCH